MYKKENISVPPVFMWLSRFDPWAPKILSGRINDGEMSQIKFILDLK